MLIAKEIDPTDQDAVISLYRSSFPHRERDSIHRFLNHDGKDGRIFTFHDGNLFVGFVCLIIYKDIVNILYLAISKDYQGHGYGHQALELIKKMYPSHRLIADIEKDEEKCVNQEMRKKRELFYLHDAFSETGIEYNYKGVDYVIMSANGPVSRKEFKEFWVHFAHMDDLGYYIEKNFSA